MSNFLTWLFCRDYYSDLDKFITDQNPTSIHEVEHWYRVYEKRNSNTWLGWR